jgi:uncharacterized protein
VAVGTFGRLGWNGKSLGIIALWDFITGKRRMNFPSVFPIKVMGANQEDFESLVLSIIQKHAAIAEEEAVISRLSRNRRFVSITVHVNAENQAQLDAIYRELSAHEKVLMML